ncbi:MAG: nucleotidyltransferase domain-containing protein [Nanoarchaeota archaeon]|nr:nucleotidyltransferase domain-containing protein [Nanoarchaeota archaeon]
MTKKRRQAPPKKAKTHAKHTPKITTGKPVQLAPGKPTQPIPTNQPVQPLPLQPGMQNLPEDAKKRLDLIKKKLDTFKDRVMEKFDKYIMGVALLPPSKDPTQKDQINVLVLVDDSDSKKMAKYELRDKLSKIITSIAKEVDKNMVPDTVILTELWQSCFDGKYELLQMIASSAPVFDKGMLAAIKISEVHKSMVLKKFEKYIVTYVLAGSLVQGKATPKSDIDVFIVIDDTDVKKMTRAELKDKLRAIIIGMGIDAGKITGVENKINIQVYILTDFWDNIKEANPIIFTFLRDGIPFYDRGVFMPWKQLLKMGKIKPSPEAIDMFMHTGDQMIERVKFRIRELGMEDLFYSILTPSQAALMMYGVPPPTPKETPEVIEEIFVKKEKMLEPEYVKILKDEIQLRKDLEHGDKKVLTGKELDVYLKNAEKYLKRLKQLFTQIEKKKEQESIVHTYDHTISILRDILRIEGLLDKTEDKDQIDAFNTELVKKGKVPSKFARMLKEIVKAKADYDAGKLNKVEIKNVNKQGRELIKFLIEYVQRKRGRDLERAKIRVRHGKRFGEVIILGDDAYIIHDIDHEEKEITKAKVADDGSLFDLKSSNMEEFEHALTRLDIMPQVFVKEKIFEHLKGIFGKDVEILINY